MGPHERSVTIEACDSRERVLAAAVRDRHAGYREMLAVARVWPQRVWALRGANCTGKHVAQRLVADGEIVLDVPGKAVRRPRTPAKESATWHCAVVRTSRISDWLQRRRRRKLEQAPYGLCPECQHDWREHDPVQGCGECRYEIEHEDPDAPASACSSEAPGFTW